MDFATVFADPRVLRPQSEQAIDGYIPVAMSVRFSVDWRPNHGFTTSDSTLQTTTCEREDLPDLMNHIVIDMLEHVGETDEIFVRILLARGVHVVDIAPCRSKEVIHHVGLHMVVHGGVDTAKSPVPRFAPCARPIFVGQDS